MGYGFEDPELKKKHDEWAAARDKIEDWHNVVMTSPLSHTHPHFNLLTNIVTTAAQALLPDIVSARRQAILAKVGPVITAAAAT